MKNLRTIYWASILMLVVFVAVAWMAATKESFSVLPKVNSLYAELFRFYFSDGQAPRSMIEAVVAVLPSSTEACCYHFQTSTDPSVNCATVRLSNACRNIHRLSEIACSNQYLKNDKFCASYDATGSFGCRGIQIMNNLYDLVAQCTILRKSDIVQKSLSNNVLTLKLKSRSDFTSYLVLNRCVALSAMNAGVFRILLTGLVYDTRNDVVDVSFEFMNESMTSVSDTLQNRATTKVFLHDDPAKSGQALFDMLDDSRGNAPLMHVTLYHPRYRAPITNANITMFYVFTLRYSLKPGTPTALPSVFVTSMTNLGLRLDVDHARAQATRGGKTYAVQLNIPRTVEATVYLTYSTTTLIVFAIWKDPQSGETHTCLRTLTGLPLLEYSALQDSMRLMKSYVTAQNLQVRRPPWPTNEYDAFDLNFALVPFYGLS